MKEKMVVMLLAVMLTLLVVNPVPSYAGGHGRHHNGWAVGGALVGGAIVGTVLGSALFAPRYVAVPAPVAAYPAPAYASGGYAYPGPAYASEVPPGEWVVIPGQWINGRWVPPHKAWIPVNPY